MILFIVLALAQGFSQNIWDLIIIRFLIGIPLGSDIANGYAYIMESMSKGAREKMGSRWQFMFGLGEVLAIVIITLMYLTGMGHGILWRIGLALGAVSALVLLLYRLDLPDAAVAAAPWAVPQGQGGLPGAVRRPARDAARRGRPTRAAQGQRLHQGHVRRPGQEAGHDLRVDLERLPGGRVHRLRVLPPGDPGGRRRRCVQQRRHHRQQPGDRRHLRVGHHFGLRRAADAVPHRPPAWPVGLRTRVHRLVGAHSPSSTTGRSSSCSPRACLCGGTTGTPPTA